MPRPNRKYTTRKQTSTVVKDDSANLTLMNMDPKMLESGRLKLEMMKSQVKDKMKQALGQLNALQKRKLEELKVEFENLLLQFSEEELNKPIDINSEEFRNFMLGNYCNENDNVHLSPTPITPQTVRRRSKSANTSTKYIKQSTRIRSTSIDTYVTPKGRIRLSSILSNKKYTVTKLAKPDNTVLSVKRIMKPDEVAISTSGSPLMVASCNFGAPHVNIPLPGGFVLNIEPKDTKGELEVPGLDAKTKSQLKILCEQLKKLC